MTRKMTNWKPKTLSAVGQNAQGTHSYKVRFECDEGEVEYTFLVEDTEILGVSCEPDFMTATYPDTGADLLCQAILDFHKARQPVAN